MKRRNSDRNGDGVSEVIGALMLTLIVVASLSAFFLFISDQQDEYQKNEDHKNKIKNESLILTDVDPFENGGSWNRIILLISSEWTELSMISSLRINDNEVKKVWTHDSSNPPNPVESITFDEPIQLEGREDISLLLLLDQSADFYDGSPHLIALDSYIKIEFRTTYSNTFSRTYVPPTAVFKITTDSYWDSTPPTPQWRQMTTLDATDSIHSSDSEYIVKWTWSVITDVDGDGDFVLPSIDPSSTDVETDFSGVKVRMDAGILNKNTNHQVTLRVTDNVGLEASDVMIYYL